MSAKREYPPVETRAERDVSRFTSYVLTPRRFNAPRPSAFTLVEMLAVISIVGILVAVVVPSLGKFKPNATAGAEQVMLAELGRARQLAISQRTTVYMVFVPTNFWLTNAPLNPNSQAYQYLSSSQPTEIPKANRLLDKQLIGYTFVALKSLGDQPGQPNPHYLAPWRTLPDGAIIPMEKFEFRYPAVPVNAVMTIPNGPASYYYVYGFQTNCLPFPSDQSQTNFWLPGVAFNYLGQLVDQQGNPLQVDEIIPLAKGSVVFSRNADKTPMQAAPTITQVPPGNATNSYDMVKIDWFTGRARPVRLEVK
jgi:prepilin-type N-terminal cleavage/methylation domain-containing protein